MPRETTPFTRKVCSTSGGAQHQQPVGDKRGGFKARESRIQGFSWKKSEKGLSLDMGLGLGLGWGRGGMFIFKLIRRLRFFKAPERNSLLLSGSVVGLSRLLLQPRGGVFLSFFPAFLPRKFLEQAHRFLLALFQGGLCIVLVLVHT